MFEIDEDVAVKSFYFYVKSYDSGAFHDVYYSIYNGRLNISKDMDKVPNNEVDLVIYEVTRQYPGRNLNVEPCYV